MRGRFITFEGGEGSGKSTQITLLSQSLRDQGIEAILTREPGGSTMGERIRTLLLDPTAKLDPITQLFLFNAARRDHVVELIEPTLKTGKWVLCDRFADSSRAYQGAAGQIPLEIIAQFEMQAVGSTRPDLTFILDIAPEVGLERARKRLLAGASADAFEAASLAFHEKVRAGFLAIARSEQDRCVVMNAAQPMESLHNAIVEQCNSRLKSLNRGHSSV
jgi:dTMP kinase